MFTLRTRRSTLSAAALAALISAGSATVAYAHGVATLAFDAAGDGNAAPAGEVVPRGKAANDSADVAAVVERFHGALASGDSAAVLRLLADDVAILESGGIESRDEYRAHHLPADIEFARAIPGQRGPVRVHVRGDVAWVTGTSTTQGEFRGRQINSAGAELIVLARENGAWKIRAIHWSSRSRRGTGG